MNFFFFFFGLLFLGGERERLIDRLELGDGDIACTFLALAAGDIRCLLCADTRLRIEDLEVDLDLDLDLELL